MKTKSPVVSADDDGRRSVLVVDDNESNRKLLKAMLAPLGVDVTEASGGRAALKILTASDHNVDVVLLDMMMPEVDGMQVLKTLAERGLTPALLVLVITANDLRSVRWGALEAGAIDFITKPVDRIELLAKCRTMLELSRLRAISEEQRAMAQMRYRDISDNTDDIVVCLRGSEVMWISPSVEVPFGDPPECWIGTDILRRIHPEDVDTVVDALQEVAQGKSAAARARLAATDGGYRWIDGRGKPYLDNEGNTDGVIAVFRVVDDQVEVERLAKFDHVTGLVNRAETIARFEAALQKPRTPGPHLGVLFCDVDHFKQVNDTFGHGAGDVALSTLATRIRGCLREGDTVGRTGGDEILVLLPGMHNLEEITQIANKIRCRAAEPIHHSVNTVHLTLSIGATVAVPGESVKTVMARADAAMYQAKQAGRNTIVTLGASEGEVPFAHL